ncbi:2-amino-4-hydroxy-6-hydroxymethyldihydropteridine diphosphokinase [Pleomorphomonas diazotrophica]|uniref:2-amino-4-hydroxy-6-hydroxymethyldihydropteridine pyrophosphokinase n=1 Tax=Pleomorphomonas diazotrophica TaxID=1166257 RepID=A0A1I4SB86_9HYPH|nr:2-amino-4-hydroxy-6-hydroxymethyldihydropteridine diphosphokinase [Pleomorphomonas diazotrophica]PKR88824.1 2-amino-4-hydroxy-6-hydroxymethyldihydropteridine diphosphokinase [Pleomorphomonas diazotrophica]SFM61725.1 2-amino-4-hydroxy-6-hydroxymethyldihydropteridinediphosphokinase [Pleomorphomonas diazotrophica]
MARAALSLGGNIGDVRATIADALRHLEATGARVVARSSDYRTRPWGKTDQPDFTNVSAVVETVHPPLKLLEICLDVERQLGRVRHERWGPRLIDIDLIAYDNVRMDTPELTLPHRHAHERGFVLIPLAEIAPDLLIGDRTVADLAARFANDPIEKL